MDPALYDQLKHTVVRVRSRFAGLDVDCMGSGVVFDNRGFVLTSTQAIPTASEFQNYTVTIEISYFTSEFVTKDTGVFHQAKLALIKPSVELAVLVPMEEGKNDYIAAEFCVNQHLAMSQRLFSITHLHYFYYTGLPCSVSHLHRVINVDEIGFMTFFQVRGLCDVAEGIEGGPIFDEDGKVVSVINGLVVSKQRLAVMPTAVSEFIQEFHAKMKDEEENEKTTTSDLGKKRDSQLITKEGNKRHQGDNNTGSEKVCSSPQRICRDRKQRSDGKYVRMLCMKYWIGMLASLLPVFSLLAHALLASLAQVNVAMNPRDINTAVRARRILFGEATKRNKSANRRHENMKNPFWRSNQKKQKCNQET